MSTSSKTTPPPAFRYTPGDGYVYTWHGGEYIEIHKIRTYPNGMDLVPAEDVINVWDYKIGAPRIKRTSGAFAAAVDTWRQSRATGEAE